MKRKIVATLTLSGLLLGWSQGVFAVFALEVTQQVNRQILDAINGNAASIPGRVGAAVQAATKSQISAMTEVQKKMGAAGATKQTITEYGQYAVLTGTCGAEGIPASLYQSTAENYRMAAALGRIALNLTRQFNNNTEKYRTMRRVLDKIGNVADLVTPAEAYDEETWKRRQDLRQLAYYVPSAPINLNDREKSTVAGQTYETVRKRYEAAALIFEEAQTPIEVDQHSIIDFDKWRDQDGGKDFMLYDLPPDDKERNTYSEVSEDGKISKNNAMRLLSRARLENVNWWQQVGQAGNQTWQLREQTLLAGFSYDTQLRILNRLDQIVGLLSILASERLDNIGNHLDTLAKDVIRESVSVAGK